MKREILFRGVNFQKKWVYGSKVVIGNVIDNPELMK